MVQGGSSGLLSGNQRGKFPMNGGLGRWENPLENDGFSFAITWGNFVLCFFCFSKGFFAYLAEKIWIYCSHM